MNLKSPTLKQNYMGTFWSKYLLYFSKLVEHNFSFHLDKAKCFSDRNSFKNSKVICFFPNRISWIILIFFRLLKKATVSVEKNSWPWISSNIIQEFYSEKQQTSPWLRSIPYSAFSKFNLNSFLHQKVLLMQGFFLYNINWIYIGT